MLKSPISVKRWPEHEFISEGSAHLTSRICKVELDPTPNSKVISKLGSISVEMLAIGFPLLGHLLFISMHQAQ
jgi:hypothetical protein